MKDRKLSGPTLHALLATFFDGDKQKVYAFLRAFAGIDLLIPAQPEIEQSIRIDRSTRRLNAKSTEAELRRAADHHGIAVDNVRYHARRKMVGGPERGPEASSPQALCRKCLRAKVGVKGFEPSTSWSRTTIMFLRDEMRLGCSLPFRFNFAEGLQMSAKREKPRFTGETLGFPVCNAPASMRLLQMLCISAMLDSGKTCGFSGEIAAFIVFIYLDPNEGNLSAPETFSRALLQKQPEAITRCDRFGLLCVSFVAASGSL
jgi:hypothetical protein